MRWLILYLRSRRAPMALTVAGASAVFMWSLSAGFSEGHQADVLMVVLTVLVLVAALTTTLGSHDDALERTAALSWPPRRVVHLLTAFLVVVGLLAVSLVTPMHFGPALLVARDAAGLLGLTALGAAVLSPARSWFAPLGWTLAAVLFPSSEGTLAQVLTWQCQEPRNAPAAVTCLVLAVSGLVAYAAGGPARRAATEVAV
jgi:hypothetical protein